MTINEFFEESEKKIRQIKEYFETEFKIITSFRKDFLRNEENCYLEFTKIRIETDKIVCETFQKIFKNLLEEYKKIMEEEKS